MFAVLICVAAMPCVGLGCVLAHAHRPSPVLSREEAAADDNDNIVCTYPYKPATGFGSSSRDLGAINKSLLCASVVAFCRRFSIILEHALHLNTNFRTQYFNYTFARMAACLIG